MSNAPMKMGSFIRVKETHENKFRAGKDGMVVEDFGNQVSLVFGWDRHCVEQRCECVGPEMWDKSELDFRTLEY